MTDLTRQLLDEMAGVLLQALVDTTSLEKTLTAWRIEQVTTPANDLRVMLTAHLKNLDPIQLYNELDDFCELITAADEFMVEELTNTLSLGPTSEEMDELRRDASHG